MNATGRRYGRGLVMARTIKRFGITVALIAAVGVLEALPAAAAPAEPASCVGFIASTLASSGQLDVGQFQEEAATEGYPNFGAFVREGAQEHSGSFEACNPAP